MVWASWVGSARRAVLYASCWLVLSVSSSVWVELGLGLWVGREREAWGVVWVEEGRGSGSSGGRGGVLIRSGRGVLVWVGAGGVGSGPGVELGVVWVWSVGGKEVGVSRVRSMMGEEGGEVVGWGHGQLSCVVWGWSVCIKGVVVGRVRSVLGEKGGVFVGWRH